MKWTVRPKIPKGSDCYVLKLHFAIVPTRMSDNITKVWLQKYYDLQMNYGKIYKYSIYRSVDRPVEKIDYLKVHRPEMRLYDLT